MTRAVIYGRVSKDRSEGRSVDDQLTECRTWADRQGWTVVAEHRDDGISASRYANGKARLGWQSTMDLIATGKVDLLVVWEVSRATRDRTVWSALLAACQERDVKIGAGGKVHDPSDPDDGFMLDLGGALAVRESAVTSKRIQRRVRRMAADGLPHGKIPYGFRRVYDPETRRLLRQEPDPETAPVVEECARRLLAGEALYAIAADYNHRGLLTPRAEELARMGKPVPRDLAWDPIQVKRLAITPTNAGLRSHNGVIVGPATWPGLISEADHRVLVDKLTDPARKTWRDGSIKHLLVGIAECGVCGAPCRRVKNRGTPSYMCSKRFCVVRSQRPLDEYVTAIVVARLARPDVLELLAGTEDPAAADAARSASEMRARLNGFYDEAAAGRITPTGLARIETRLLDEIKAAERLARPRSLPPVLVDTAGPDAAARWDALSVPQRREVIRVLLVPRVMLTGKGTVHFRPDRIEIVWKQA